MAWIAYKKAYDIVPHSWILESLRLVGVAIYLISTLMENHGTLEDNAHSRRKDTVM